MQTKIISLAFSILAIPMAALGQGAAFTYQGRLLDRGTGASGSYDLTFTLFDSATVGGQVGLSLTNPAVAVNGGPFTRLPSSPSGYRVAGVV